MLMWVLIVLLIIFVTYKLLDHILRLPRVGSNCDRYILITGCDSGFGHELAKRLDLLGCHVFAGCFTETGETELKKICSERMHPVPLDITNHDSITRVFELICNKLQLSGNGEWESRHVWSVLSFHHLHYHVAYLSSSSSPLSLSLFSSSRALHFYAFNCSSNSVIEGIEGSTPPGEVKNLGGVIAMICISRERLNLSRPNYACCCYVISMHHPPSNWLSMWRVLCFAFYFILLFFSLWLMQ